MVFAKYGKGGKKCFIRLGKRQKGSSWVGQRLGKGKQDRCWLKLKVQCIVGARRWGIGDKNHLK